MNPSPSFQPLKPEEAVAFDPIEFQFAFTYAAEVSHQPATLLNDPTQAQISLEVGRKTGASDFY
jgi:hypothetical protein